MPATLFRFIWDNSKRQQFIVFLLTLLALPFYYASLELPKLIINQILGAGGATTTLLGFDFHRFDPITWLALFCVAFLIAVAAQGGVKYGLN
ncbi:MAG: ABC transporter ATP-binding protein, partial [Gammaproteobacteria bacterium]|nr:ABC transporter ATP-binding protein [Gammaproteobacteria bacterium]